MSGLERWFETLDRAVVAQWVASRPPPVRDLLRQFPLGSKLEAKGDAWFVFGATEEGHLIIAPVASEGYDDAMARRAYLCGGCLRQGQIHWENPR